MSLLSESAESFDKCIHSHYIPGFGLMPAGERNENFYAQIWARDAAHAAASYCSEAYPDAVKDSLETIFRHQLSNGALPYRVEKEFGLVRLIPGLWRLASPLFRLIEGKKRLERPLYEGESSNGGEDTVPAVILAAGTYLRTSHGNKYAREYFRHLIDAVHFFETKVDPSDGLAVMTRFSPDWAESIQRKGKLGYVNIIWVESLYVMNQIALEIGEDALATEYASKYERSKRSLLEKIYNSKEHYFRAKVGEDRIDTPASLLGALFFLDTDEAVAVEKTLRQKVRGPIGYHNFEPKYQTKEISLVTRFFGVKSYHNDFVWPWVSCQAIRLMIWIAERHQSAEVRDEYKAKALESLIQTAELFRDLGGAYETVHYSEKVKAQSLFYYPPRNFLASLAGFMGAFKKMQSLGWM